jgi:hypothetical protein
MKKLLVSFIVFFTLLFSYTILAQEMGSFRRNYKKDFPVKLMKPTGTPLAAGTYTIGSGGDFPTIDSAFNKLSVAGIAGEVVLELTDNLYTAPTDIYGFLLNGPIPGADQNNGVTIKPAVNENVIIEGSGWATLTCLNASYVTIDGIALTGPTTLTFHALYNNQFDWNDGLDFVDNSDHNIIQNINFICEDYNRLGCGLALYSSVNVGISAPDSNYIQNNFVKKGNCGILLQGTINTRVIGNIIKENIVGSENDSLIGWGIQLFKSQNGIVENNVVQNLKVSGALPTDDLVIGINSYWGSGDVIRNNIVHNLKSSSGYTSVGILLSGSSGQQGNNNFVYDIQSTSTTSLNRVTGIQMWDQNNPKIYYNSVYLSGTGSNKAGSAALYVQSNSTNVDARNNIFVNTRDESPYDASSIYDYYASNILTFDYNDLYYSGSEYNCLVKIVSTKYNTLADWQATGKDLHSISEMPNFIDPDLHIDTSIPTNLEKHATPLAGIVETDFDGDIRNATTPDIGADEFDGIVVSVEDEKVLPIEFALGQNYPNPFNSSSVIKYSIPKSSQVLLKIFNTLSEEIETLIDEEQPVGTYELNWNAANLPSGVYFYQIKAGDFIATKKMILLK